MTGQIEFTPLTPESMARLTLDEQMAFLAATGAVAQDQKPSLEVIATVVLTVQRLTSEPADGAKPAGTQRSEAKPETFQKQASRYFRAAYGPDYLYRPPESFGLLERWIWAVGAGEEKFAEKVMASLERAIAESRDGDHG